MANLKIPRLSDRDIGEKLETIYREINGLGEFEINFHVFGQSMTGGSVSHGGNDTWKRLIANDGSVIEYFGIQLIYGLSFFYHKGGQHEPKSAYFDEINFSFQPGEATHVEIVSKVAKLFRPFPAPAASVSADENINAIRAIQEGTLERLERLHEDGIRRASETLSELQSDFRERNDALEKQHSEQREELEDEAKQRAIKLDAIAEELERRKKALDDRDNTHVRREIRNRMLEDVKARIAEFGVSRATSAKRVPVFMGIGTLGVFFLILALTAIRQLLALDEGRTGGVPLSAAAVDSINNAAITLWIRLGLSSLAFSATVLFYIRWQNRWAEQHANSEFALQQFHVDVNRANWVLESCLEWQKVSTTPIPEKLLESFTRGLFTAGDSTPPPAVHPADELASALLGSASKLKLRAGENELEFDKPGKIPKNA